MYTYILRLQLQERGFRRKRLQPQEREASASGERGDSGRGRKKTPNSGRQYIGQALFYNLKMCFKFKLKELRILELTLSTFILASKICSTFKTRKNIFIIK